MNIQNNFEETDDLITKKPTVDEYEKAKEEYQMFCSWLRMCRDKKNELIDALAIERQNELMYEKQAEKRRDIIRCYEIYEEIEARNREN